MTEFSIWEVLFLLCFSVSWPVSIAKSLRTKVVIGKSPMFMSLIVLGYIFGIIHNQVSKSQKPQSNLPWNVFPLIVLAITLVWGAAGSPNRIAEGIALRRDGGCRDA